MLSTIVKRAALVCVAPALLIGFAAPAAAQSSTGFNETTPIFSEYTQDQGLFSEHARALLGASLGADLTDEQRNALWFGPTSEDQAIDCREKYGLNDGQDRPDIVVQPDCSLEVIEADLYEEAVAIAVVSPFNSSFGSSSTAG